MFKFFMKNQHDVTDPQVRKKYTYIAGTVGIIVNFLLFVTKLSVGLIVGSIAIMADGFNNLADTASSVVTVVGVKLSQLPADKEHPYGHGRLEYVAALIVAFLVMFVGFQLGTASVGRILNPEPVTFDVASLILLGVSVLAKVWLSRFNIKVGNRINSAPLRAAGVDSLGDVLVSGGVLVSFALAPVLNFPIDGFMGAAVALFILYMGFKLVRETVSPLLGEAPDKEMVDQIHERIKDYQYVIGSHDLHFHNYGVGRVMATMHVEFAGCDDLLEMHDILDKAERDLSREFGIHLVIHMDPVATLSEEAKAVKKHLRQLISGHPCILSVHDFRLIQKTVVFDLDINAKCLNKEITEDSLRLEVQHSLKGSFPDFDYIIATDRQYID